MCGIIGALAQRDVTPILLEGLRLLEYRGYDSAGLAVLGGNAPGLARIRRVRALGNIDHDTHATSDGAVHVFKGPVMGEVSVDTADVILVGDGAGATLGTGVSRAGDMDSDGHDDLLVLAPGSGEGYLLLGPMSASTTLGDASTVFTSTGGSASSGAQIKGGLDIDGDGNNEVLIGRSGSTWIQYGPMSGTISTSSMDTTISAGSWSGSPGQRIANAHDVDGDGLDDILIGDGDDDEGGSEAGAVHLFYAISL